MVDTDLADEVIARLNAIIESDEEVRADVAKLVNAHIPCSRRTAEHETIQVTSDGFGFLGMLNGIVGTIPEGPRQTWGYITASFDDDGRLERFERTNTDAGRLERTKTDAG